MSTSLAGVLVAASSLGFSLAGCSLAVSQERTQISSPLVHPEPGVEQRAVEPFRRIHVEGTLDVEVRVGWPLAVELHGDDGRLVELRTDVRDGTLLLGNIVAGPPFRDGPRAIVSMPELDGLVSAGSGWVLVTGLDQERVDVDLRGSGDVRLRGRVSRLRAHDVGAGDLDWSGLGFDELELSQP
jgi:hypothetical protein